MSPRVRTLTFLLFGAGLFALLGYGLLGLAPFGHYPGPYGDILNQIAVPERHVLNVVTAVIFDYRGFDTLGEEFILFACVTGVTLLMRHEGKEAGEEACAPQRNQAPQPPGVIPPEASEATRFFTPVFIGLTLVFGAYIVLTGHLSLGGGFQGGVILAGAWLMLFLAYGSAALERFGNQYVAEWFESAGAGAYALIGLAALVFGKSFLTNILPLGQTGDLLSSGTILLINFAVTNSVGAFLVLVGISLLYGRTGALNLAQVGESLARHPADGLVLTALTLILGGFFVKAAVVPFHFWLADAHAVAPTPVCVLFSGVMVELGLYGAFRVYRTVFAGVLGEAEPSVRLVLMSFGALTALLGAVMCYAQRHFKRLLAFSTISHVGVMLTGFGTLSARGTAGAGLYLLGHAFVKGALFLCAGLLLDRFASLDEHQLQGKGRGMTVLACTTMIGGLGLAGFPPFGTYLGKQLVEEAVAKLHQQWLSWLFLLTAILTGGAVLRVAGSVFVNRPATGGRERASASAQTEEPEITGGQRTPPVVMLTVAVVMVVIPALSGIFGHPLATGVQAASERFNDRPLYLRTVLDAQSSGPVQATEEVPTSTKGVVMGIAAATGAVGLALLELLRGRIPQGVQRAWRAGPARVLALLQRLQSGHVGDYITWLVVGVVVLGAAFVIAGRGE